MKRIFIIGIVLSGLLFSCNKGGDNKDDSTLKQDDTSKEICLEMVYPLTFIMPDGSTITGDSRKEIGTAIKSWHEANPSSQERAIMQYPVEANFKNRPVTINNDREMQRLKKACAEEKKPCFYFIYPITYIMPDETSITVNSKDDRENMVLIRAWYGENPGVEEKPALQYPVDVKLKDGTIVTLSSDEDMQEVREGCK